MLTPRPPSHRLPSPALSSRSRPLHGLAVAFALATLCASLAALEAAQAPLWTFACSPTNDLYRVASSALGQAPPRYDLAADAVTAAPKGTAVLVLADGYPDRPTEVGETWLARAAEKDLRVYLEYPATLPDLAVGAPRAAGLERGVVASEFFGPALPPQRIVAIHGCRYTPVTVPKPHLVLARVAGVDTAVFGLQDTATQPVLFDHPRGHLLVATTKLSQFVTGRYAPADAWRAIWEAILTHLQPGARVSPLRWTPTVRPTFGPDTPLPVGVEAQALKRSADWIRNSRILRHRDWPTHALDWSLKYNTVRDFPKPDWPIGDGSLGVLEGFSSTIRHDGSQPMRYAVRNDCLTEVAMLLAFDGAAGRPDSTRVSTNLLHYLFTDSGLAHGPRADPGQASYGTVGWALDSPESYWGDDNARAILAMAAVSALTGDARHDEAIARCVLANFRTTGRAGYREECITESALRARGWPSYWNARHLKYSPHFEAWLWPCFLWAYDQTGFAPLLERTRTGAQHLMAAYPDRWYWCNRSGAIERARALLPLAWLVRIEDTPEHRRWLRRVAEDLIALQDKSGAIRETIGDGGHGTASNAEYGTQETSLIQTNGDPICDLLYTCNFAVIGLHEAAAATGEAFYREAEDRLAAFLCRVQVRSEAHPELDGAWYRAFDFRRWEYWASNADWEWGPWCTETGWTQPWIAGTFALRQRQTSLWDLLKTVRVREPFLRLRPQMLPDEVLNVPEPRLLHAATNAAVTLATAFAPQYSAGGPEGLTDGLIASTDYRDPQWQGYHGVDAQAAIDLGRLEGISRVECRFLQQVSVGIFLPTQVTFECSTDGEKWEPMGTRSPIATEREAGPLIEAIGVAVSPRPARFLRIHARNLGRIPEWVGEAGGRPAWLFLDEVLVDPKPLAETQSGPREAATPPARPLYLSSPADHDLHRVLQENGVEVHRFDTPEAALEAAPDRAAVLILADRYPVARTALSDSVFAQAERKQLRMYLEFPERMPGWEVGAPMDHKVERAVVASDFFGPTLPPLRLLGINGLHYVTVPATNAHLVAARVAGFDTAVYGLPKATFPLLLEHSNTNVLVATTALSRFVTGRYAPTDAWQAVWSAILGWLNPGTPPPKLRWTPMVRPAYARDEALPPDAEVQALRRGVDWFIRSKLLLHPSRLDEVNRAAQGDGLLPTPPPDSPVGDGSLGILEAPLSIIRADGSQMQGVARRGDCTAESAMALAFGGRCFNDTDKSAIARRLLDFYLFDSDARKRERADPNHTAYGHVAWGITTPAWYVANYGDDNARLMLGTLATAALLGEPRWDEATMLCLLANLRTTGRQGFRSDRLDLGPLGQQPWTYFYHRNVVNLAPHFEAYLWACNLWAYHQTGDELFLTRTREALRATVKAHPNGLRWTNGLAQERARLVLPLAWLVRVQDTPEHRDWLRQVVEGLLALQHPSGGIREELGPPGQGMMPPPRSNEEYGLGEASLIQQNGDPVSDLLYTVNFALLGLHEAVAATRDPDWARALDRLAEFLVRIQIRSEARPELDGGWFRAFDLERWEAWASNADAGWGAWAIESGWTQGWIASVLALRQLKTSLWDLTANSRIEQGYAELRRRMMPEELLVQSAPKPVPHEARGKPYTLAHAPAVAYADEAGASLTDGEIGSTDHSDPAWLGLEGLDLVATLDLGAPTSIRSLAVRCLESPPVGIYLPQDVEFAVGQNGQEFEVLERVERPSPPGGMARVHLFASGNLDRSTRYVRIRARNFGTIPAGQPGAGAAAWLFADEVMVNPQPAVADIKR